MQITSNVAEPPPTKLPFSLTRTAAPVHVIVYARHGRDCCGVQVSCTKLGVSRRSIYQMNAPIDKVLDEGNCGKATDRGEEVCECVRKCRPVFAAGRILVKAALATNRNVIQGRVGQASEPNITKPFPENRLGKWRACSTSQNRLVPTRMYGGGGAVSNGGAYPIYPLSSLAWTYTANRAPANPSSTDSSV